LEKLLLQSGLDRNENHMESQRGFGRLLGDCSLGEDAGKSKGEMHSQSFEVVEEERAQELKRSVQSWCNPDDSF